MSHVDILKLHSLKATPQRLCVLDVLEEHGHVTLENIERFTKLKFPTLSLSTIYRNINEMLKKEILSEVKIANKKEYYEITKENHTHLICSKCGKIEDFQTIAKNHVVDGLIFAGEVNDILLLKNLAFQCKSLGIEFILNSSSIVEKISEIATDKLNGISFVHFKSVHRNPQKLFIKRIFDFIASLSLTLLLSPLGLIIALLIKMDSPGPAIFSQERIGENGRRFLMYKFRSMVVDAEKMQDSLESKNIMDGPAFKIENDPRITRLGKFIRETSLDEFPQLFNILKGEMSLVGPRPLPVRDYKGIVQSRHHRRFSVQPGITCFWQVSGRSEIGFDEWMKLDLQYIDNWSLTLDLKILLRTIPAVLLKKGAK